MASSFDVALAFLGDDLSARWVSVAQAERVVRQAYRFASFCERGFGVVDLDLATSAIAATFVTAPCADGTPAGGSLQRFRCHAVRSLYRVGRLAGLTKIDPTADLRLPPLSSLRARPLTDDEIVDCRGASRWSLASTRRSTTLALAEATCRSGEIPNVLVGDIDLEHGGIDIRGGGRCAPRSGQLTPWGILQVEARLAVVGDDPTKPLVYDGGEARLGGLVSANSAITQVLQRAGVAGEPDVRPSSVVAWAGARVLETTGRIEDVARALGLRSLDSAATFIGWQWLETDGHGRS
ncbi:MAG: hypothetical protein ACR2MB_17140 [Acidimicrobiales bacterium]